MRKDGTQGREGEKGDKCKKGMRKKKTAKQITSYLPIRNIRRTLLQEAFYRGEIKKNAATERGAKTSSEMTNGPPRVNPTAHSTREKKRRWVDILVGE